MGVRVSCAAKAVGEDHSRPSAIGYLFGFEKGGILVDRDCSVVDMSRKKSVAGHNVSRGADTFGWGNDVREDLRGHRPEAQELGVG